LQASYRGHKSVVDMLLSKGANTSCQNENKDIPLHLAALANRLEIVQILADLSRPASKKDLEASDAQGYNHTHNDTYNPI
jgi:ankyrin repeat protein